MIDRLGKTEEFVTLKPGVDFRDPKDAARYRGKLQGDKIAGLIAEGWHCLPLTYNFIGTKSVAFRLKDD